MKVVWDQNEANNPTEQGLDADSLQENAEIAGTESGEVHKVKNLVVSVHRHLDGQLLRVMKTIANAGRVEIHVDVP